MHAEPGHNRLADLAGRQLVHGFLKLGHELPGAHPAEVASFAGAAILRVLACQGGEIRLSGHDPAPEVRQTFGGRRLGELRAGPQQDVARAALRHRHAWQAALAPFEHLQDVKARAGAHRVGNPVLRQAFGGIDEDAGKTVDGAHAQVAVVAAAIRRIGKLPHQRREVLAGTGAPGYFFGAGFQGGNLRGLGVLGHGHQHHGQAEFGVGRVEALLFLDEQVDVGLGHLGPGLQLALAHAGQQDLVSQVFAELGDRLSVLVQPPAKLCHGELVLVGDGSFGLVHRGIVDLDTRLARQLQLNLLVDHAIQHLARQRIARRNGAALLGQLLFGADQFGQDLVVGDRFAVDHHHDEIRLSRSAGCGAGRQVAAAQSAARAACAQAWGRAKALRGRHQRHQQGAGQGEYADPVVVGAPGRRYRKRFIHSC